MVGQVDDRVAIGCRAIVDASVRYRDKRVITKAVEIPGIAFFAILAEIRQMHSVVSSSRRIPNAFIKAFETTVKMIRAVVLRKLILNSVEREASRRRCGSHDARSTRRSNVDC